MWNCYVSTNYTIKCHTERQRKREREKERERDRKERGESESVRDRVKRRERGDGKRVRKKGYELIITRSKKNHKNTARCVFACCKNAKKYVTSLKSVFFKFKNVLQFAILLLCLC